MLKIKEEFMDQMACCPLSRQMVYLRFMDEKLYDYYYTHGLSQLFEEIIEEENIEDENINKEND
jgi:hypothetical protein